ncbi:MAG: TlpA family protein disulfide reductase [Oscillospiraceae bacterium]|nr:TlpA family protein disulfide reductase [Oscillospiraceae bacterium]
MKKTIIWVVSILVLIFLMIGAVFLYEKLSEEYAPQTDVTDNGEAVSYKAPDFEVVDENGNTVRLSDFFGKPIVLNFWASWCPPCKAEMPEFDEIYKQCGDEICFLMVNSIGGRETLETAKSFLASTSYTFPVYFDTKYDAAMTYGISSLPTTIFIDKDGNLVTYANGAIDGATLLKGIEMIKE